MQSADLQRRPYGMTIFCDDIRQEVGGKLTYVGCYNQLAADDEFPISLPRLCLAVHYFQPASASATIVEISVLLPGEDSPIATNEMDFPASTALAPPPDAASTFGVLGILIFELGPLTVQSPGYLRVRGKRGSDIVALGTLNILPAAS